jgi:RNAse (barnase) inhibitor barstar
MPQDPVRRYVIEGSRARLESDLHAELQRLLGLFTGYGYNLDALADVLTDDTGLMKAKMPFEILWKDSSISKEGIGEGRFDQILKIFLESGIPVILE